MIDEQTIRELHNDAVAARDVGETCVCHVNCSVLLELLHELDRHQVVELLFERKSVLHPAKRD